jgi:hypothetical protein
MIAVRMRKVGTARLKLKRDKVIRVLFGSSTDVA